MHMAVTCTQGHYLSSSLFLYQVLSPLAKNLFHRAISESGVAIFPGLFSKNPKPVSEVGLKLENSFKPLFLYPESWLLGDQSDILNLSMTWECLSKMFNFTEPK